MAEITLEPGSPSERIAAHFKDHQGGILTRRAVATLLEITPALADTALQAGIGLGVITAYNDGELGRCYKAGPRLQFWAAPAAAASAKPVGRGGKHKHLPLLQLSLLQVAKDLPLPAVAGRSVKGTTKYDAVLDKLSADGTVITGIPLEYKAALKKAIQSYLQARPALANKSVLVVRDVDEATVGIWRVPKGTLGTEALKPATPKPGRQPQAA